MRKLLFVEILLATIIVALAIDVATAEDCPPGVKSCVVVTMSPEEISTLTNPGGIFDLAIWANRAGASSIVDAWKKKIETSPPGTVKAEPKQETK